MILDVNALGKQLTNPLSTELLFGISYRVKESISLKATEILLMQDLSSFDL